MENFSDIGKYLRIPRHEIKLDTLTAKDTNPFIIEAIAEKLRTYGRNILPVIVEETGEDSYKILLNADVFKAAGKAELDYVWCILADEERKKQVEVESKQKLEINLLTASEPMIAGTLDYINGLYGWKVDTKKASQVIIQKRNKIKTVKSLSSLSCGYGDAKISNLQKYFVV